MSFGLLYAQGSFTIDNNGHIPQVTGAVKFNRDIQKMLITESSGNVYGTDVKKLLGSKLSMRSADLNLKNYLKTAIYNYTLIQKSNPFLDSTETISNASLTTWVDTNDPNALDWNIEFDLDSGVVVDNLPNQSISIGK
jgi:hypothetical protein